MYESRNEREQLESRNLLLNRTGREKATLWLQLVEDTTGKRLWARDALKNLNLIDALLASISSVQFSCSVLSDSLLVSVGLPVHHQLLESTQTHVHRVNDAIQPSHPLSSPSPPALNLSQHQGLFQWVRSLHQVAKVLEFQLQHQSFQWTPRTDLL